MGTNNVNIKRFDTPADAPIYRAPDYKAGDLQEAVVVGKGTEQGRPTVDFIFADDQGQKYIAMLTGALVQGIAAFVNAMSPVEVGDVIQLPADYENRPFASCFAVVKELKDWGILIYVQAMGEDGSPGKQAYLRVGKDVDFVRIGRAEWVAK